MNHKYFFTYLLCLFTVAYLYAASKTQSIIDRRALVERHKIVITEVNCLSPLSVGNGRFTFTTDITGLQTFPEAYKDGLPLTTMAQWGWHSFDNPKKFKLEDTFIYVPTNGRKVPYNINSKSPAASYLRANPHQTSLAKVGFILKKSDGSPATVSDLTCINQELDLWTGILSSSFELDGKKVLVKTVCHPEMDEIAFEVRSDLIKEDRLAIEIAFPYANGKWGKDPADWDAEDRHKTYIKRQSATQTQILHELDDLIYTCKLLFPAGTKIELASNHHFRLKPPGKNKWSCSIVFVEKENPSIKPTDFDTALKKSIKYWKGFWTSGGAIDLSESSDVRWKELERRIVLSQYLTAIQSVQKYPPQETGLTCTSWFGKFHLEMHWWHSVHFALWDRFELFEPALEWYKKILPVAQQIARRQGYEGARWPKMVSPSGQDTPSTIAPLLIWQQPHPIYYAELCYRQNPSRQVLEKYKDIVFQSAAFMASFASWNDERKCFELGPPLISAREFKVETYQQNKNPTFELAYWRWGLLKANEWRKRLSLPVEPRWQYVAENLAPLPIINGIYVEQETPVVEDGGHPCQLAALGVLPSSPQVEPEIMEKTLEYVLTNWKWQDTWGWDFPMMAMTAARLGRGDLAVNALLLDVPKNTYLKNGHNFQRSDLPCYLPGNGGLLTAVAMMATGWDGCADQNAPGFPKDGKWVVKWENLKKMP